MSSIPFGKYRHYSLDDIASKDPGYLQWMLHKCDMEWVADHRDDIEDALRGAGRRKAASAPPVTVTAHQQERVDQLQGRILAGQPIVRLDGGAGYGKSYTVKKLLLALREHGYAARACAVSYVATQVLATDLDPYGFTAATVARTLKQAKTRDPLTGEETYVLTPDSWIEASLLLGEGKALVVDECSMINDEISDLLLRTAVRSAGALILVGDDHQLPPVKQEHLSPCCGTPDPATLTEPMRYSKESDLYQMEQAARHRPWQALDLLQDTLLGSPSVRHTASVDEMIEVYAANYRADPFANHRMLLFRRRDVVEANNAIRTRLFGAEPNVVEDGEKLMILRTTDYPYKVNPIQGDTTRYYSGQAYNVLAVGQDTYTIEIDGTTFSIPHYTAQFPKERVRIIFGVSETLSDTSKLGGTEFTAAAAAAAARGRETADWKPMQRLMSDFVSVAYQYATSVHRAQGQTADYAYVAPRPLLGVKGIMGPALAYVALTRAKKQLVVAA